MLNVRHDLSVFELKVEIPSLAFFLQTGLDKHVKEQTLLLLLQFFGFQFILLSLAQINPTLLSLMLSSFFPIFF